MSGVKFLTGPCGACGAMIRFPANSIGNTVRCPYCRTATELTLATPVVEPTISRRAIILGVVTLTILILGVIGVFLALHRAQDWAKTRQSTPPPPPAANSASDAR